MLDPEHASSWEDGVAVGIEHRLGKVGRGDRVADGQSGVLGKGSTGAKVGDGLPGADLEGSVVAAGFVAEVVGADVVGRREYEGLLGED